MPGTMYENQSTASSNRGSMFTTWWRFQSFTVQAGETHVLESIDLNLKRVASPGNLIVEVYGITATKPDIGGGLLASGITNGNDISDSANEWVNIAMSSYTLVAGTQYAIVARLQNEGLDSSNSIQWYGTSTDTYADGINGRSINSGSTWTTYEDDDFAFKEYGTLPPSTKTFTAQSSIAKDDITKTLAAQASISQDALTKTFTADVNTRAQKQFTANASIWQVVAKTFIAQTSVSKDGITKTFVVDTHIYVVPDLTWPPARPDAYSPDKMWDEESKSWYSSTSSIGVERVVQGGGRFNERIVVVSEQGNIYFGDA